MTDTWVFAPDWQLLSVVGPDAASWLNGIVTCDVTRVDAARGQWGLVLTKTGKIMAELIVLGRSDELSVCVSGGDASQVEQTLGRYLVMEDAELSAAPERAVVILLGAGARALAGKLGWAALPWADEGAYAGLVARDERSAWLERAVGAGAVLLPGDVLPVEQRLEFGLPAYGIDYGERDNPHEAGLERRAISWSKGCYLGQEVVCMQDMRGKVKRRLAVLLPGETSGEWRVGAPVSAPGGEAAGELRSVGAGGALAMLGAPWFEPGTELRVEGHPARVAALAPPRD